MYFNYLLDALLGPREILHEMECSICGCNEVYYVDPENKKQIGRACEGCNYVQTFSDSPTPK